MIGSFRHKGLERFFDEDDSRRIRPDLVERIRTILTYLQGATRIEEMRQPTLRLHPLKGDRKGFWAVTVRANWRIVFRFEDGVANEIDLVDYH
jgi:proteic killer suppression protein